MVLVLAVAEAPAPAVVGGPAGAVVDTAGEAKVEVAGSGCEPWPAHECAALVAVEWCESRFGTHPDTYSLDAPNGGRLQINRATWEGFFLAHFGWTWEQIVLDDAINYAAAYVIWERAGGSWRPWSCWQGG